MWIKSLEDDTWVNMKHVTHFSIELDHPQRSGNNLAYAYIDTPQSRIPSDRVTDQVRVLVCQGNKEECEQFILEKQLLEGAFQWLGYLVAGGVGGTLLTIYMLVACFVFLCKERMLYLVASVCFSLFVLFFLLELFFLNKPLLFAKPLSGLLKPVDLVSMLRSTRMV